MSTTIMVTIDKHGKHTYTKDGKAMPVLPRTTNLSRLKGWELLAINGSLRRAT